MNWKEAVGRIAEIVTAPLFGATTVYIPHGRTLESLVTTSEGRGYKRAYQIDGREGIEVHVPTGGTVQIKIDGKPLVVEDIRSHGEHHEGVHIRVEGGSDHHLVYQGQRVELPDLSNVVVAYDGQRRNDEFPSIDR